jgi:hypothetical protein
LNLTNIPISHCRVTLVQRPSRPRWRTLMNRQASVIAQDRVAAAREHA